MKRVLLTGGVGSIGIHVVSHIMHETDWEVVILDSFRHKGYRDRLEWTLRDYPEWRPRISDYQTDLVCPISSDLKSKIGKIDYILHLAAVSDVFYSVENPVYTIQNNVNSTLVMLEYAREIKPEIFIYFSTDEIYGPVKKGDKHKEWDSHKPSNAYAASKAASEDICYCYWRSYGVPLIITNSMNNFSMMQSPYKFPVIIQNKLEKDEVIQIQATEGEIGSRCYIHSRNTADALLFILKRGVYLHKQNEIDEPLKYHIVGDVYLNNLELAQRIAKLMGKKLKYEIVDCHTCNPAHDVHYGLEDNNLRPSGWKQPVSFDESMKDTIDWQGKNREWIV